MTTNRALTSDAAGRRAEFWAAMWLRLKAYQILATRVRTPQGEIDLVARKRRYVVFVEVKARPDLVAGMEAVTPRQINRIIRAAEYYSAQNPKLANLTARFDLIVMRPKQLPVHILNAWDTSYQNR